MYLLFQLITSFRNVFDITSYRIIKKIEAIFNEIENYYSTSKVI